MEGMQEKVVEIIFNELKGSIDDIEDAEGLWQRFMPMGGQELEQLQKFIPGMGGNFFSKRKDFAV